MKFEERVILLLGTYKVWTLIICLFGPARGTAEKDLEQKKTSFGSNQGRNILLNLLQKKSFDICRKIYEYNI